MSSLNSSVSETASRQTNVEAPTSMNDDAALSPVTLDERLVKEVKSVIPKKRQDVLAWYGWGYKDTKFYVDNDVICFQGEKYPLDGCALPFFTDWVYNKFNIHVDPTTPFPELPQQYPVPIVNQEFLQELQTTCISYSQQGEDRLIRCHGQTLHDIYYLRRNAYTRIPDVVTWPSSQEEVERLIALAHKHNVVVIPYGGGTSVSGSITCPQQEQRMICVLDTSQMNRMLWLNRENLTVCFESGIVGQDLERTLGEMGFTVGHEPDSYEFSTLGGWVATRASGMKKNVYGNIEDLIVGVKMVTPSGVLQRLTAAPRVSCGPDFNHVIMGSEGTLGVVTEVVLKMRPLPPVKRYGSLVFPEFEHGVQFMREIARRRCQPASVRLMDHEQFMFGQSLRAPKNWMGNVLDQLKKAYLQHIKGLDLTRICAATLLFEGEKADVERQESLIYEIAAEYNGFPAGGENGERGYIMTFVIAYIRDFALSQEIGAESFETSVPWDRCSALCRNVKRRVEVECQRKHIKHFVISFRVTQTYDAGACVYFYFGFKYIGIPNPVETYEFIESRARDEILANGGSLSHHHGVGKTNSQRYQQTVSKTGSALYLAAKRVLDPKNIFATGNILTAAQWQEQEAERGEQEQEHHEQLTTSSAMMSKL